MQACGTKKVVENSGLSFQSAQTQAAFKGETAVRFWVALPPVPRSKQVCLRPRKLIRHLILRSSASSTAMMWLRKMRRTSRKWTEGKRTLICRNRRQYNALGINFTQTMIIPLNPVML